jgi:predicted lipoprotein with Yx(FWY)xxD motif
MAMLDVTKLPGGAEYLTDTDGRSLYMFEKDKPDRSTCFDACAATWPPVTTSGSPMAHNAGIDEKRLGTIRRPDGTMQVTYDHKPLYYYAQDKAAGDIKGQDLNQFGADWYLVKPDGKKQEAKK